MTSLIIEARSLALSIPIVGRFVRHNFWVLKNSAHCVIAELHGLATNRQTGAWEPIGTDEVLYTLRVRQFVHDASYQDLLHDGANDFCTDTLVKPMQDSFIALQAEASEVLTRWNHAVSAKARLNNLNLNYPAYGFSLLSATVNSNSTYHTLAELMGLPVHAFPVALQVGIENRMI